MTYLNTNLYFYFVCHRKEIFIFFKKHILLSTMKYFGIINGEVIFYFVMVLTAPLDFWICNFSGSILQSFSFSEGRWIIVVILLGDFLFILANVYGFNNHTQNSSFFSGSFF